MHEISGEELNAEFLFNWRSAKPACRTIPSCLAARPLGFRWSTACCQSENQGNSVCEALELLWLNFPATALPSSIHGELYLSLVECLAPDAESDPSPCTSEQVKMTMCFSLSLCLPHPHIDTHTCRGTSPPSLRPCIVAGRIKKPCRSLSQSKGIKLKWLGLCWRGGVPSFFPLPSWRWSWNLTSWAPSLF